MSIYEYNEEEHIKLEREEAFEDGRTEGRAEGIVRTTLRYKASVEEIVKQLMDELSVDETRARQIVERFKR